MKKCYGTVEKFLFGDFALLALALGVIGPLVMRSRGEPEAAFAFLVFSLVPFLIAVAVWLLVSSRARKSGQKYVMSRFFQESIILVFKIIFCLTVILLPFIGFLDKFLSNWETRKTKDGLDVIVRQTGKYEYEDYNGNKYYGI